MNLIIDLNRRGCSFGPSVLAAYSIERAKVLNFDKLGLAGITGLKVELRNPATNDILASAKIAPDGTFELDTRTNEMVDYLVEVAKAGDRLTKHYPVSVVVGDDYHFISSSDTMIAINPFGLGSGIGPTEVSRPVTVEMLETVLSAVAAVPDRYRDKDVKQTLNGLIAALKEIGDKQ